MSPAEHGAHHPDLLCDSEYITSYNQITATTSVVSRPSIYSETVRVNAPRPSEASSYKHSVNSGPSYGTTIVVVAWLLLAE